MTRVMTPAVGNELACRGPTTAKGEARRLRLLEIALDAFLEHGYAAASMQSIMRLAGGSAATAYRLFGNKEGLFAAVLEHELEDLHARFFPAALMTEPPGHALMVIAEALLAYSVQPRSVAVYRLLMTASYKLPAIPGHLREQVRAQIYQPLEDYLRAACARGESSAPSISSGRGARSSASLRGMPARTR